MKNIDTDYEIDYKEAGFDIENPKNELQYQLYKCTLVLEQIAGELMPWLLKTADDIIKTVKPLIHYLSNNIRLNNWSKSRISFQLCELQYYAKSTLEILPRMRSGAGLERRLKQINEIILSTQKTRHKPNKAKTEVKK